MSECRLCLSRSSLIHVFDSNLRNSRELKGIIALSAGVKIKETDNVSKCVCQRCCILVIKIYKFRSKAIQNDKTLKEQCGQHYSPPPSPPVSPLDTIRDQRNTSNNAGNETRNSPPATPKRKISPRHPSVSSILKKNPDVKIPLKVSQSHVDPVITLNKDEVTEWVDNYRLQNDTEVLNVLQKLSHLTVRKITCNLNNRELYRKSGVQDSLSSEKQYEKSRAEQTPGTENDATNVPISSNISAPHKNKQGNSKINVARKRTSVAAVTKRSGKKLEKRKRTFSDSDLSEEERMPVPKKRNLITPSNDLQKTDISSYSITNKETQKEIFTKSLELAPSKTKGKEKDSQSHEQERRKDGILRASGGHNLFICYVCDKVCNSKRGLSDHQRSHLKCKFCKKKMKHIEDVANHLNECCIVNITNNLPNVSLTRIDKDPIVLKKYGNVLTNLESNEHILKCETADSDVESSDFDYNVNESANSPHIEEIDVPMATSTNFVDETEGSVLKEGNETPTNDALEDILDKTKNDRTLESNKGILEQYITKKINKAYKQTQASLLKSRNVQYKSAPIRKPSTKDKNTVCISDESDAESENVNKSQTGDTLCSNVSDSQLFESVSVMRPEIKIAENTVCNVYSPQGLNNQNLTHIEEALIQALFVQYCVFKGKCCATQTFEPNDSSIKTLGNKLMSIENMFSELSVHKIPVELEFDEKIKINFKRITQKPNNDSNFSWKKLSINHLKDKSLNKVSSNDEIIQIDDDDPPDVVCSTSSNSTSASTTANNVTETNIVNSSATGLNTASIVPPLILNGTNFVPSTAGFVVASTAITMASPTTMQSNVSNLTLQTDNFPRTIVSQQEPKTSVTSSNTGTIWLQTSENSPQLIQSLGPQITQPLMCSPSGPLLLSHLTSPNGVTANEKVMPPPVVQQNQPRVVYSQVPNVFNAKINNYNKIVVLASNSNLQPTNSSVQSSTHGSGVTLTEIDRSSPSDQGESQVRQPLRVKSLWELTQPNK